MAQGTLCKARFSVIIIHHHHSRLTSTSSALARVGRFLPNQAPPLQSVLRPLCLKVQRAQVMSHTFTPRLLTPASALRSDHLEVSTSRHPILLTFTLEMSKPSQSTTPHNDCDFFHTQAPIQLHAWYSLLETHTKMSTNCINLSNSLLIPRKLFI